MGPILRFLLSLFLLVWSLIGIAVIVAWVFIAIHIGPAVDNLSASLEGQIDEIAKSFTPGEDEADGGADKQPQTQRGR